MPRLFTAIELPDALAQELTLIRGGLLGARWIDAADFHVTLRFIGDIGDADADEIHWALQGIRRAPFDVTVGGADVFGGDRPRAIVASVKPTPALVELQAEHERLIRRIGLAADTRKFVPHVTLARLRQSSAGAVAAFLSLNGFVATRQFRVDHFVLMSARDSVGGGPYLVEATYPLRDGERS